MKVNSTILIIVLILSMMFVFSGCSDMILMNPKGTIGIEQRSLILTSLGIMLFIVVPVIFMSLIFPIVYRASNKRFLYSPDWSYSKKIEFLIWIIPILVIIFLSNLAWKSTIFLDPNKSINSNSESINIQVIAMNWNWLFLYPKENVAVLNEVTFPVNTPVKFEITSDTVMHSFFIPQLGSQIYAMKGMNSKLNLISCKFGTYKGFSSNFSGNGFSNMKFVVNVTKNKKTFDQWIRMIKKYNNSIDNFQSYRNTVKKKEKNFIKYFSSFKKNLFYDIMKK